MMPLLLVRAARVRLAMLLTRQPYRALLVDCSTFPNDIASTYSNKALQPRR